MGQRLFQMFAHFIFIAILGGTQCFSSFNPRKDSEAQSTGVEAQQSPRLLGRQLPPLSAMELHFSVSGHPILTIWNFGEQSPGPVLIGVGVDHGQHKLQIRMPSVTSPTDALVYLQRRGSFTNYLSLNAFWEETAMKVNGW